MKKREMERTVNKREGGEILDVTTSKTHMKEVVIKRTMDCKGNNIFFWITIFFYVEYVTNVEV